MDRRYANPVHRDEWSEVGATCAAKHLDGDRTDLEDGVDVGSTPSLSLRVDRTHHRPERTVPGNRSEHDVRFCGADEPPWNPWVPFPLSIVVDNTEHRRTATQFMSENLLDIFQYGIRMLHRLHDNDPAFADPSYRRSVMTATLDILSHCLQFDFTGCTGEEGSDEVWVLQLPMSWEGLVCRSTQLYMFFDLYRPSISLTCSYAQLEPPLTRPMLEIVMLFASVRRSLFRDNVARVTYLNVLVEGVMGILGSGHALEDEDTYNMMCQLLSRLKVALTGESER